MSNNYLHTNNFKTRLSTGILLMLVVIVALIMPKAFLFRIFYIAGCLMAILELYLAQRIRIYREFVQNDQFLLLEYATLLISVYSISVTLSQREIILVILGSISTDIFAYFVGSSFHGTFFKSRPFPKTSPKKSWEGIIGGIIGSYIVLVIAASTMKMKITGYLLTFIILCPFVSIFGDFLASFCKRIVKIKDSNESVLESRLRLAKLFEKLMAGHGGFLDRIDSISMVSCLMLWMMFLENNPQ